MLSRVADSLYWMSRYLERAEHTARLVNVNLNLTLDRAPAGAARHWGRLLASLPQPPTWQIRATPDVVERATVDLANRESIAACVGAARENARQVREEISSEMWEEINRLYLAVQKRQPVDSEWTAGTHEFLSATINGVHQIQGVTDATMTHGEGWHYIELGRYLERASATASLLDVQFREAPPDAGGLPGVSEFVEWVGLLKSCCAFEAYCRHYTADVRPQRIAEFLVLNPEFPRSIHFAAARVQAALKAIAGLTGRTNGRSERLAGRLLASLDYGQIDEIIGELPSYLQDIVRQAALINSAVHQQYIAYPIDIGLA
ncbi:alpha-E domain-containing protein [Luteitalea sp.]|uniref:alpha-E domain-containing protein n=1 Tax=Luteitalea sp. TaxID=2004800 RepID=UPI0025C12041|nr:alpha-E domain-containing protein [Luteitalea sp.]